MNVTSVRDSLKQNTNFAPVLLNDVSSALVRPKLRVGVFLDGITIPRWIRHILEHIAGSPHSELALIVQNSEMFEAGAPGKFAFLRFWRLLRKRPKLGQRTGKSTAISFSATDNCKSNRDTIEQIKAADLDVIVYSGFRAPSTQLVGCAKHGIWSFALEGGETGFLHPFLRWKYSRQCTSEIILRELNVDSERVLYRGRFLNESSWPPRNRRSDQGRRLRILMRMLSELYAGKLRTHYALDSENNELASNAVAARSSAISKAGVLVASCLDYIRKLVFEMCWREQWVVAYSKVESVAARNRTKQVTILEPPSEYNYADPFLFEQNHRHYMFFEVWHAKSKGEIWCSELDEMGKAGEPRVVLRRPYHLSFPFVFEWKGEIYLLPETRQHKTIEVYRAIEFPYRWDAGRVLMNDVSAVDTIIAEYAGKLWLFTAGIGGPEFRLNELSLFFADTLFGTWKPHPKNPIVCDLRKGRLAGALFFRGSDLMRPAQDCSKAYGQAVTLNRITVLSESDYKEEIVSTIVPDWMPNIHRVHTFNQTGRFEVLDACRIIFRYPFGSAGRAHSSALVVGQKTEPAT